MNRLQLRCDLNLRRELSFSPSRSTGKERDTESGNDYFGARYYASAMGRFLSPDWSTKAEPVPYASLTDPQTLNLFAYVRNNPLRLVDSDGHGFWEDLKKTWNDAKQLVTNTKVTAEAGVGLKLASKMGGVGAGATVHYEYSNKADPITGNKDKIRAEVDAHSMDGRGVEKGIELQSLDGGSGTDVQPYTERTATGDGPHDSSFTIDSDSLKVGASVYEGVGGGLNLSIRTSDLSAVSQDASALKQSAASGMKSGVQATKQTVRDVYYSIKFALDE